MFSFLKSLFSKKPSDPSHYEAEKIRAQTGTPKQRMTLAKSTKTNQEILYYLAEHDPDPLVRRAVANNAITPLHASSIIAADVDEDVRLALAHRLVKLLPDLSEDKHSRLYAFAVQAMGTLALDEVLKIRMALSTTLRDHALAPPKVVGQLARDIERQVAEPILRYCVVLDDEELLDILKAHPASWAVEAIAGRKKVGIKLSRAIIDSDNRPAGQTLLGNVGAEIDVPLLQTIIDKARNYPEWQKPIAMRTDLPKDMAKQLAEFADGAVRDALLERGDFDEETMEDISSIFLRRLDFAADKGKDDADPFQKVRRLEKEGRLNEETLSDALAMRDRAFVCAALARMARTTIPVVEKIIGMKAPKPIVALCWRAGLSMRCALQVEKELAQIPHTELIYPRGGTDYPFTDAELKQQLAFLGIAI